MLIAPVVTTGTASYILIITVMKTSQAALEYVDILADVTIGKNLLEHYLTVRLKIGTFNRSIDSKKKLNEEYDGILSVCYRYYQLQDIIQTEVLNKYIIEVDA